MRRIPLFILFAVFLALQSWSQVPSKAQLDWTGQLSAIGSFAPQNTLHTFFGGRYISGLNLDVPLDSTGRQLSFVASGNISGSAFTNLKDSSQFLSDLSPYRIWARYTARRLEVRLGLQKIDFGSGTLLRPLQWFNQIDPRDPLQLTNGVYAGLGRYYFKNNANLWLWVLYGNKRARGFDLLETYSQDPELGGRFQYPVRRGEIAVTYHHRTATSDGGHFMPVGERIPENRVGIDGKFDWVVGLWFEAAYIHKKWQTGITDEQIHASAGVDYTFPIGNGLHLLVEHMLLAQRPTSPFWPDRVHISAATASYPLGMYDHLSFVYLWNWGQENPTLFLNYSHNFKRVTGYIMAFYNPNSPGGFQQNDLVPQFRGPGIRLMAVFHH